MKRKPYTPSETHLILNPPPDCRVCSCGVKFVVRPENHEDDPDLCLTCNRKEWSKLWEKKEKRKEEDKETGLSTAVVPSAEIVLMRRSK